MRLRFAPSPTGYLHIGNARTAIINHIIAQSQNAQLILRIEDTDMERSSRESEESILNDLSWLGITWDEGPNKGGSFGPYRQSERFDIYNNYTQKLIEEGKAYHCYCLPEEIEEMKAQALKEGRNEFYNGRCRHLTAQQKEEFEKEGRKPTVRFHVPANESINISDSIKGDVSFNSDNIGGDFIIVRSDGVPVYNYIVVIDDALMEISHVIRGEDHLSNTPKQILIAQALDFELPVYAHMPLIMGDDRKKLSKRHGITSVTIYREQGYLPEALYNYISMLGWSLESGEEIVPKDEIYTNFNIEKIAGSGAVFDFKKLKWMNGNYIREKDDSVLYDLFYPFAKSSGYDFSEYNRDDIEQLLGTLKRYCELLSDIGDHLPVFLEMEIEYTTDVKEMILSEEGQATLKAALQLFEHELTPDNFSQEAVNSIKEKTGLKGKKLFMSCRAVITGRLHGPDFGEMMQVMGFQRCLSRIHQAKSISG